MNTNELVLNDCSFVENTAEVPYGPYWPPHEPGARSAPAEGGAIYNTGELWATNTTFHANRAKANDVNDWPNSTGARAAGGALYNVGTAVLVHLTFEGNEASGGRGTLSGESNGGAVYNPYSTLEFQNCLLANSLSGGNVFGLATDRGNNLSSDATPSFTAPGSRNHTDPKLGPLGDYGGPTPTLPLLEGSPALDGGNPDFSPPIDQRGRSRPFGAAGDIGAFESSPPYTIRGTLIGYGEAPSLAFVCVDPCPPGANTDGTFTNRLYRWDGLPAGTYRVIPTADGTVFAPLSWEFTLGPDVVGADFKGYQLNALTPEVQPNGLRLVYAGDDGQLIRWLGSMALPSWQPFLTNALGTNRLAEYLEIGTPAARFYQVVSP
jgi:hypothetical protein